ncbi:polyprenyl synthetase family protein [Zavarzinella formosa]|uniref:polyprenyl synthetase family protein n=1 Tax=Zavarzinella formosa TaxID=360055 RepID=UPI0003031277|nr:farnesyl diphosphate synthase [Zavarzinella formosa]
MSLAIVDRLKTIRDQSDTVLRQAIELIGAGASPILLEAMSHSLFAPGKRLRPILTVFAAEACGGDIENALTAGCAVEMIHTYSLIHDDLPAMDDDDLRRGLPTCHVKYGEPLAILAGDALLTGAFQVLAEGYPPRTAAVSCVELARGAGAAGMVDGQVRDLAAEGRVGGLDMPRTLAELEGIHLRKTGALFRSCVRLGAFSALTERDSGRLAEVLPILDEYARAFGLAFQVTDDLLDVEGNAEHTGKRTGKDADRGKMTFPGLVGVAESRRRARELHEQAIAAVRPLGDAARALIDLARLVTDRDR